MALTRFHFLRDYRRLVRNLMAQYPLPEAMSIAAGGNYDAFGEIEKRLLVALGLQPQHTLVDVGCGSGRLAKALVPYLTSGRLLGTDVVQELLDYARDGCPADWRFVLVDDVRIPFADDCADFACFFSVFTHLLQEESYCYLLEARRVVKPGGLIVFSFLEYAYNWEIFESTCEAIRAGGGSVHLNTFIGRDAIESWARHIGMRIVGMRDANEPFVALSRPVVYDDGRKVEGIVAFGQSVCVLSNDKPPTPAVPPTSYSTMTPYKMTYPRS